MIKKGLLLGLLFMTGVMFGQTVKISISNDIQTRDGKQYYVHTVKKGQTLYSIAKAYHVGLDEIYYANPETRQGIRTGQKIWIPTVNKETEITHEVKASKFDFFYHVAAAGETIDHIASIYLIPKRYILLANPGIKSPLKEGEYVKIPVESAFPVLDGKVTGQAASKRYTGGLEPPKPVLPPVTHTSMPAKAKPVKKANPSMGRKKARTMAPGTFNPDIPVIKDYRHVVVAGETLKSIARKYGITENELKSVNPGLISAFQGERLRLPVTAKVPGYHPSKQELEKALKYEGAAHGAKVLRPKTKRPKAIQTQQQVSQTQPFLTHKVKKKETLYSISREYGVKLSDLYEANPGLTSHIKTGQVIRIPKKKISTDFVYYQAQRKISLKKVAKLFLTDVHTLFGSNPAVGKKVLPGQVVRIPVGQQALLLAREEQQKKEASAQKETVEEKPVSPIVGIAHCQPREHKRLFQVALMVPLYLEETDSINRTEFMIRQEKNFAPFRFIKFLEGALIASDSLRRQGMQLELHVYDVDQTLTKTAKVLTRPELKNMNLIIGPFYSRSFKQVALFADHFGIPIVNPLTFRTEILHQHEHVIKVTPDEHQELPQLIHLISKKYKQDKVFLISQTVYKDADMVNTLRDSIRKVLPDSVYFSNLDLINTGIAVTQRNKNEEREQILKEYPEAADTLPVLKITFSDTLNSYYLENQRVNPEDLKETEYDTSAFANSLVYIDYAKDSLHPFEKNASVLRTNLVILYGTQKSFVMDAMNRLNVLCDTFRIKMIGLPLWESLGTLNLHQMNNMQTTYPSSYYVDYHAPAFHRFNTEFYNRFATSPEKYGVLGFDMTYYFLRALYLYGKKFPACLPAFTQQALSTRYRFERIGSEGDDFENTYWNWLSIQGFRLIKLPDTLTEPETGQEK